MPIDYNGGAGLTESVAACMAAFKTLQQIGHSADADEVLAEAESTPSYANIDKDTSRSAEWKLQHYALAYMKVMSTLARKLTATADLASTQYKMDAETVFGVRGLPGDPGFLIVSLRDAQDRIEGEYNPIKLQRLLDKAVLNGDAVRAHAIVESAVNNRDYDTVAAFQRAYPALAEATARLWSTAVHAITSVDIVMSWRLGGLKPAALGPLQDYEIAAAAAGNTSAGAWNV